jgi:predicted DNA-binding transcriptional regulator YafY
MDLHLFAEELMEFADEIEILSPQDLADLVRKNLQQVSDAHA